MSPANSDNFSFSFPIWIPSISLSYLIAMAKTSKAMLNKHGEIQHLYLLPDLRGNAFNFSPLRMTFAISFSYMTFIMLREVPSMSTFWRVFLHLLG